MAWATPVIGLTGGIATGKSTIAAYLQQHYHWPLLDADILSREAVRPGTAVLARIVDRYGEGILHPEGHLNRAGLGERIFGKSQEAQRERRWLEQQIHPWIRQQFTEAIAKHAGTTMAQADSWPPLLLVVPLLFEAQMTDLVTEIWVVYCTPEQQKARLQQRDGYDEIQVRSRLEAQMPLSEKCEQATLVLDNSGPASRWQQQIKQWLQQVERVEQ
ncbi:dephospho-CoA kinase [Sodalinema gerasimenkoae]|uniref:dephospho-CoA kinase n=1 Tax=Sodalinema gerasimenkoae TaxID=2862348 RepID=UPI0013591818|nr:dephospho-CoA kinase [Sodalinema gerasimenkoae]